MDRVINLVALAVSICALAPLLFKDPSATKRRIIYTLVICMVVLLVGNHFWMERVEKEEAERLAHAEHIERERKASEYNEHLSVIKRDIIQQLEKGPLTFDQIQSQTNIYGFDELNQAIDELRKDGVIDTNFRRLRKDPKGEYEAKIWYLRDSKVIP